MLRVLLILSIIGYLLYKLGLFRVQVGPQHHPNEDRRRPAGGNVNVDSNPDKGKGTKFKGGEYVDYEEVK